MKQWSTRQVIVLILSIFLGMGTALSGVQANIQNADPVVSVDDVAMDADVSGLGDCDNCGGNDGGIDCGLCTTSCGAGCSAGAFTDAILTAPSVLSTLCQVNDCGAHQRLAQPDPFPQVSYLRITSDRLISKLILSCIRLPRP